MIRITVELVCARGRSCDKLLGVGEIANVGGDAQRGVYQVWLSKMAPKERSAWKAGSIRLSDDEALQELFVTEVQHFDREKRGAWDLVLIALRQLIGDRNPGPEQYVVQHDRIRTVRRRQP